MSIDLRRLDVFVAYQNLERSQVDALHHHVYTERVSQAVAGAQQARAPPLW